MEFNLKSGTNVRIENNKIYISRVGAKGALKGLFAGRVMGEMVIKLSSVSGMIQETDCLYICGSGLPTPKDFKLSSADDNKQLPNCITGPKEDLVKIFNYIDDLL